MLEALIFRWGGLLRFTEKNSNSVFSFYTNQRTLFSIELVLSIFQLLRLFQHDNRHRYTDTQNADTQNTDRKELKLLTCIR